MGDLQDIFDDDPDGLLDDIDAPDAVPFAPARTLDSDAAARLRQEYKPRPDPDLDPSLARQPDTWTDLKLLIEMPFEIYDRKANKLRVITRAFTRSSLVILAKQVLDELAGVRSPASARELHAFVSGKHNPVPANAREVLVCDFGTLHDPSDSDFVNVLVECRSAHCTDPNASRRDAQDQWHLAHRPYVFMILEAGNTPSDGKWYFGSSSPDVHPHQDY